MKNEAMLMAQKLDGEQCAIGEDEERRRIRIRNVWNSRSTVEIEVAGVRLEVEGAQMITAIENALRSYS